MMFFDGTEEEVAAEGLPEDEDLETPEETPEEM